ncbi:hypothetical protein ACO9S2_14840 [Nitrospira sp. NS4]|uniref:hypothetical protein n=1 Tax=Nitrospira sp. NS4 TaxID=3414498 RepID=UPI003C2EF1B1
MAHQPLSSSDLTQRIEPRILAFCQTRPRMMFSDLAKALPDYTWQMLFSAITHLRKQHYVELLAHPWDYEVLFLGNTGPLFPASPSPERNDERDHDERTDV